MCPHVGLLESIKGENMKLLRDKRGLSVLEVFCITVIGIILGLIIAMGVSTLDNYLDNGNDSLMANTAESVARINLAATDCVVTDCSGKDECTHKDSSGYTVGYYDKTTHHILEYKMAGYNEFGLMRINGTYYRGNKDTMIIKVRGKGQDIELSWVRGDNQ